MLRAVLLAAVLAAPWSAPREVSRPHPFMEDVSIAFVPNGAGLIGWRLQDGDGVDARGGEAVAARSASGDLGTARFRRAQLLEHLGPEHASGLLDLALTGRGNAVVAWAGERVRAAETDAGGRFGAPVDLSPTGASQTDVAATADGARVVVWSTGSLVQAAYAAPGAPFGPPEDVGPGDAARAAFPRAGAQPVVVWRARRPAGTVVQESARTG